MGVPRERRDIAFLEIKTDGYSYYSLTSLIFTEEGKYEEKVNLLVVLLPSHLNP